MNDKIQNLPSAAELQENTLRAGITEMLGECTEKQRAFFNRIHDNAPWKGFINCPSDQLPGSYELVRRTVASNRAAKAEGRS